MPFLVSALFLLAYLWLGSVGTITRLYYQWPALGAFGLCLVLAVFAGRPHRFAWSRLAVASVIVLVAYVLVRAFQSPIPYSARKDVCLLLGCFAVYLLFVFALQGAGHRTALVTLLGLLGVANTVIALYQRLRNPHFHLFHGGDEARPMPGSGLFFNYDHMSGFTELAALLCLAMAIFGRGGRGMRTAFGLLGSLCCLGVLVSMSRGGFLSLGAGLLTLGAITWVASKYFKWSPMVRKTILVVGLVAVIGFAGAGVTLIGKRFEDTAAGGEQGIFNIGFSNRLENWSLALRQWRLDPLLGTGSGTYDEYSIKLWRADWHRPDRIFHPINAHNDYVQMLAEYGAIGLGLVLLVLAIHGARALSTLRGWLRSADAGSALYPVRGNTRMALVAGGLCCLVAYSVHSVVDFNMRLLASACVIAFCLAVIASAGPRRKEAEAPEALAMAGRVLGGLLGLWLLLGTARNLKPEYHFEKLDEALHDERIEDALAHGASAVETEKENDILYRWLGYARMRFAEQSSIPILRKGFLAKAIESLRKAVDLNPGDSYANVLLGRCLDDIEDEEGATKAFKDALEWDPYGGDTNGWYGDFLLDRGLVLLNRGDNERAITTLREAEGYLLISTQSSDSPDIWQQDVWKQCIDALHEAYSARGQYLETEALARSESGSEARAQAGYREALAAYKASLEFKSSSSPDAAFEVSRVHEISAILETHAMPE
jgi:O-antigen ligase